MPDLNDLINLSDLGFLLGRILIASFFLAVGVRQLKRFSNTVDYVASLKIPFPKLSAAGAIAVELILGSCIVLGVYCTSSALILAMHTLITAYLGHNYWSASEEKEYGLWLHFYKNISITGGLIILAMAGPGNYAF
ncbi:DoxX family protein [Swingsia samuiensis]|nr:DoxX family protein [Swingsia samuiensis]